MNNDTSLAIIEILTNRGYQFDSTKVEDQIDKKLHRVVLIIKKNNHKFVFKYLNTDNKDGFAWFNREADLLECAAKYSFSTNKMIERSDLPMPWMIVSFVEGAPVGSVYQINPQILKDSGVELIDFLLSSFKTLALIKEIEAVNPQTIEYRKNRIESNLLEFEKDDFLGSLAGSIRTLQADLMPLIENQDSYSFCHSDLRPINIMTTPALPRKFSIIDWEFSKMNLMSTDAAFIFNAGWRSERWQEIFIARLTQNFSTDFIKLFNFQTIIYLSLDLMSLKNLIKENKTSIFHSDNLSPTYLRESLKLYENKINNLVKLAHK